MSEEQKCCPEGCHGNTCPVHGHTDKNSWEERFERLPETGMTTKQFIASEIETERAIAIDDAASIVESWHISKGGFTELAWKIRALITNS